MSDQGEQISSLEKAVPLISGEAFADARDKVPNSGQSILVSDGGKPLPDNPKRRPNKGQVHRVIRACVARQQIQAALEWPHLGCECLPG